MSLLVDLDIGLVWEHVHNGVVHNGRGVVQVKGEGFNVHGRRLLAVYAKDQLHDVFEEGNDVACVGNDQFEVGW